MTAKTSPKSSEHPRVDTPAPLSRDIPTKIHDEAVKVLIAANGGAAVALLAFLQNIWEKAPRLTPYVILALLLFGTGVAVAAVVNFVRASAAVQWEQWFLEGDHVARKRAQTQTTAFRLLSAISGGLFLLGIVVIAAGAWTWLPAAGK